MTNPDLNWSIFWGLCIEQLSEHIRDRDMVSRYLELLNNLRSNHVVRDGDDEVILLGMHDAPASVSRHHTFQGGLVAHMLEMWDLWKAHIRPIFVKRDQPWNFTDSDVLRAILHHDLNKVWRYKLSGTDPLLITPWQVSYANELDRLDRLLGPTNKSLFLLQQRGIKLGPLHYNALLCAAGGYGEIQPRASTVFAKTIYLLDELSANVVNRLDTGKFWDSQHGGGHVDEA